MPLTDAPTLESYFAPQLDTALDATGVPADPHVRHYLVTLLVSHGLEGPSEASLVELELRARDGDRRQRCRRLRRLGDQALFTSGLFAERLKRRGISQRYYRDKGSSAYAEAAGIAARGHGPHADALRSLARRFDDFVAVLRHLRGETHLSEPRDAQALLRRDPALAASVWQPRGTGTLQ